VSVYPLSLLASEQEVIDMGFTPVYASYSSTATQSISDSGETTLTYTTVDVESGGISQLAGQITVPATGIYRVITSVQCNKTSSGIDATGNIFFWFKVGAQDVTNSGTKVIINKAIEEVMTVEVLLSLSAANKISVVAYSTTPGQEALAIPKTDPVPLVPSIITIVQRIA
jgi:hypothetical protein